MMLIFIISGNICLLEGASHPSMLRMDAASYFRCRFHLCSLQVLNPTTDVEHKTSDYCFVRILQSWEFRLLEITFCEVSWCQLPSLVIPNALASLPTCPGVFSRTWISDDFWLISGVLVWGECFAPPLQGVPQVSEIKGSSRKWGGALGNSNSECQIIPKWNMGAKHSPPVLGPFGSSHGHLVT